MPRLTGSPTSKITGQALASLSARLGYTLQRESPAQRGEKDPRLVEWLENGQVIYTFHLMASALVGWLLRQDPEPSIPSFLVLPGGRAGLLAYKLERDPGLRSIAERWHILKFRHLRRLAGMGGLTRAQFEKEFSGDPIEPPEQMKMF